MFSSPRVIQRFLFAGPVTFLLLMGWQRRWVADDGFIHLRVVEQVLAGHGPVFNAGERVEASTSALWVGLLSLVGWIPGLSLPWMAVLLGIGLSCLGVGAAQLAGSRLYRTDDAEGSSSLFLPLGALAIVVLPPFWDFASSGLETGLSFGWIGGSCWWVARRVTSTSPPDRRAELAGAGLIGLGWMIRPDLAVFSLAFGAVLLAAMGRDRSRRGRVYAVVAMVTLPLVYQVFRMGFYAMVVPNTALTKEAGRSQWRQGLIYLNDLLEPYRLWLPVLLLVGVAAVTAIRQLRTSDRLWAAALLAPAAAGVVHGIYVIRAGGDFMHGRLLLPSLFGLLAPIGIVVQPAELWQRVTARRWSPTLAGAAVTVVVAVWAVLCAGALRRGDVGLNRQDTATEPQRQFIADERAFYVGDWKRSHPVDPAGFFDVDWPGLSPRPGLVNVALPWNDPARLPLRPGFTARTAQTASVVGMVSVEWGPAVHVLDQLSLAHPVGSHMGTLGSRPGHQKPIPTAWLVGDAAAGVPPRVLEATPAEVHAARAALGCGELWDYLYDIREPMTPRRFLGNIRDSITNTQFRIPRDPVAAKSQLCG